MLKNGFSLIELLIIIAILGILSSFLIKGINQAKEASYLARAKAELRAISQSVEMYRNDHQGKYPDDANRSVPPGLEAYLPSGDWPEAVWTNSVFDWDNWTDPDSGEKIYQISIRFCPVNQPDQCHFPNRKWAEDFQIDSSVYYCLSGPCRAHIERPIDYPGYCVNCQNN